MTVAPRSPVSAEHTRRMLNAVFGIVLDEAELNCLFGRIMQRRPSFWVGSHRFRLQIVSGFDCWLHHTGCVEGLYLQCWDFTAGVMISKVADLGGHCSQDLLGFAPTNPSKT